MSEQPSVPPNSLVSVLRRPGPLLTCYLPIGDPLVGSYLLDAYAEGGVNILELGMPSGDPRLDGPDIADSMARAMQSGTDIPVRFREMSRAVRARAPQIGTVCMTYADSAVLAHSSSETFEFVDATLILGLDAGIPGIALPPGTRRVAFVPKHFSERDIERARRCDSYVMLQATDGLTGPRADLDPTNAERIQRLRDAGVQQRILLGFGISTPGQARAAIELGADGVIIGSVCVRKAIEGERAIRAFVRDVRAAIDA
ncbi:MAG: tryptophan synthase subunit alpha [Proteobacteria bacterium]|nr:tryptophan synthase subunit alpha [Pseudomonadota bacterium]